MRPTALIVGLTLALVSFADAMVLCRDGKRLTLRPEHCRNRETRVDIEADILEGRTLDDIVKPLEARLDALEKLVGASSTTTPTSTTSTTTRIAGPARVTGTCVDATPVDGCVATVDCYDFTQFVNACAALCEGHGGGCNTGGMSCDDADPTCQ